MGIIGRTVTVWWRASDMLDRLSGNVTAKRGRFRYDIIDIQMSPLLLMQGGDFRLSPVSAINAPTAVVK
jgi:hypothetical protein